MSTDTRPPEVDPAGAAISAQRDRRKAAGRHPSAIQVAQPDPDPDLTPEEQKAARDQWRTGKCTWCGGLHLRACPRVRSFEFANDGKTVTRVEFWPDGQWPDANIIWPEDMGWSEDEPAPTE